ncbi:MAG TPA: redoxin domain-containing protein [Flavobacteriaceae bacterium]|nr:redoxin domain-containing protein [Flavobacteriaceae bacterium]HPF11290.1 redoxin domain-containing protein [Flavobacteriaceae bacterium]HQU22218.1 redoxin domain-containing protein [Flavobacteriaceae bacterium]HQU64491.1 redoxin domain-containing protein [Flavobacteriaceae bacterium]HRW44622.1 redoxin domain-containing protein [Flavobacteriaceae bacterium]
MGKLLLTLFLLAYLPTLSQSTGPKTYFSESIGQNIRKYRIKAKKAYIRKDEERAQFLFDSLVENVVKGSYLDNFRVSKFSGRRIEMYDFEKPIYLITYASWCTPGIGEIPALNDIVDAYHNEIDFVMLFWGSKKKIRKMKHELNNKITILYVDEKQNRSDFIIRVMKHSLGFPTSFFIDKDKKILDVRRNFFHPYGEDYSTSYNNNYQTYTSGISLLKAALEEK